MYVFAWVHNYIYTYIPIIYMGYIESLYIYICVCVCAWVHNYIYIYVYKMWVQLRTPWNLSDYNSTIVLRILRRALNWALFIVSRTVFVTFPVWCKGIIIPVNNFDMLVNEILYACLRHFTMHIFLYLYDTYISLFNMKKNRVQIISPMHGECYTILWNI